MDHRQTHTTQHDLDVPARRWPFEDLDNKRQEDRKHDPLRHRERVDDRLLRGQDNKGSNHGHRADPFRAKDGNRQKTDAPYRDDTEEPGRPEPQIKGLDPPKPGCDGEERVVHADMPFRLNHTERRIRILQVESNVTHVANLRGMRKAVIGGGPPKRNRQSDGADHETHLKPMGRPEDSREFRESGETHVDDACQDDDEIEYADRADAEMRDECQDDYRSHQGHRQHERPSQSGQKAATQVLGIPGLEQREARNKCRHPKEVNHSARSPLCAADPRSYACSSCFSMRMSVIRIRTAVTAKWTAALIRKTTNEDP